MQIWLSLVFGVRKALRSGCIVLVTREMIVGILVSNPPSLPSLLFSLIDHTKVSDNTANTSWNVTSQTHPRASQAWLHWPFPHVPVPEVPPHIVAQQRVSLLTPCALRGDGSGSRVQGRRLWGNKNGWMDGRAR